MRTVDAQIELITDTSQGLLERLLAFDVKVSTLLAWRADFTSAKLNALREILVV